MDTKRADLKLPTKAHMVKSLAIAAPEGWLTVGDIEERVDAEGLVSDMATALYLAAQACRQDLEPLPGVMVGPRRRPKDPYPMGELGVLGKLMDQAVQLGK
jgi:predicted regulator of Ras-like GTPase activity (Roadblock/LC7/MglB family)